METIRSVIADDHAVVRAGLRALIATEAGMTVVAEAADGQEAVTHALALKPDVILLDLLLPQMSGAEAISAIRHSWPDARILVLSSFADDERVFPALKAGALGYLLKDSSPHDLLQAIRDVAHGESALHPSIARKLVRQFSQPATPPPAHAVLTEREVEVLSQIARGRSNQQIADALYISERTVRTHVSSILEKLHLANRTQATLYALREGLVNFDSQS